MVRKSVWTMFGVAVVALAFVFTGCKSEEDDSEVSSSSGSSSSNFFYTAAQDVGPTIESGSGSSSMFSRMESLTSGGPYEDIYTVLRDYEYPRDEGVIDMHNIYKVLYTAGQIYATAESSCTTITDATIDAPFSMGLDGTHTYDCAGNSNAMSDSYANGYAIRDSGDYKYGLLTYRWSPDAPDHLEHGVLQGTYADASGDLDIRMLHHVIYDSTSDTGFAVRTHLTGNDQTHAFTIKMVSTDNSTDSYISLVGKGVSQGSGEYFLFKANTQSYTGKYFCIAAPPTESDLETMEGTDPNGKDTVDSNCTTYQTDVDAMSFLDATNDVPKVLSDFTNSSILLTY